MNSEKEQKIFGEALEEHGAEGLEIMMGTSSLLARGLIYILVGLIVTIFIWSFFGKADVIVAATGQLEPDPKTRDIYAPTDGELVDIYVAEGMIVSENNVLARIKAPTAIQAASAAMQARVHLDEAEREKRLFPQKKIILEKELESIHKQIENKEKEYQQLTKQGLRKLSEEQKIQLAIARNKLNEAERDVSIEKDLYDKYQRLYKTTGGGGISRKQIEEQRIKYLKSLDESRRLKAEMENIELKFSKQYTATGEKIDNSYIELLRLRYQYDQKGQETEDAEVKVDMKYRAALAQWEAASRVSFDDLDQENFLKITAPIAGEITHVSYTQTGEKVKAATPIVSIAPSDAKKKIVITIYDRDRGLLKVGQLVKLKFAAFPFQRYGFIKGKLEYISPATVPSDEPSRKGQPVYTGRVSFERDYFLVNGEKVKLRYGMTATSEIVVRERRFIDLVLDPFRNLKG